MSGFDFESLVVDIPDCPKPGVVFKDIMPLFESPEGLAAVVEGIAERFADAGITKVVGAEARGFMVGAPVAYRLGAGFVAARKPGKLPRQTVREEYALEYGTDALEIHADALSSDDTVLVVDDLLATGGTACAQIRLVRRLGARLAGTAFIMELSFLDPRKALAEETDAEVFSLVKVG